MNDLFVYSGRFEILTPRGKILIDGSIIEDDMGSEMAGIHENTSGCYSLTHILTGKRIAFGSFNELEMLAKIIYLIDPDFFFTDPKMTEDGLGRQTVMDCCKIIARTMYGEKR